MYFPLMSCTLLIFDGDTGQLVTAMVRPGKLHRGRFARPILRRLVQRVRRAWPGVAIELRADSGFALPAVYDWCDQAGVAHTIGLIPNPALERAENWIKAVKLAVFADRLTDHGFWANAFRLLLHAAAYALLDQVRRWLAPAETARHRLDTLRLHVTKIGSASASSPPASSSPSPPATPAKPSGASSLPPSHYRGISRAWIELVALMAVPFWTLDVRPWT
jgi:hypothetical protein